MFLFEKEMESKDIDFIVKARNAAERKVTEKINVLKRFLVRDENGNFVTTSINVEKIKSILFLVEIYYHNFSILHFEYLLRNQMEVDPCFEQELIMLDVEYRKRVLDDYDNVVDLYNEYLKANSCENRNVLQSEEDISKLYTEMNVCKASFESKYSFAESICTSTDDSMKMMAGLARKELQETIENYLLKVEEYKSALEFFSGRCKFEQAETCLLLFSSADMLVYLLDLITSECVTEASPPKLESIDIIKLQSAYDEDYTALNDDDYKASNECAPILDIQEKVMTHAVDHFQVLQATENYDGDNSLMLKFDCYIMSNMEILGSTWQLNPSWDKMEDNDKIDFYNSKDVTFVNYMGKGGLSDNLDPRSNYNLQVAGRVPKKSPEWLKAEGVSGEKDRSVYYFAMQSEDKKTVLAQDCNLFYESKILMQTIPLFDIKYSGKLVYSKYSSSLVGRWQPIELFDRDRSALDFLLHSFPPPPDRCVDLAHAKIINIKMIKCSQLLLASEMLAVMTSSSNWHWQDLLTDILRLVMEKPLYRSEISLGIFLLLFEVDDGCWTEIMMQATLMMIRQTLNRSLRIPVN